MKHIDLDTLKTILRDHVDDQKQAEILQDIQATIQEEETETKTDKPPKIEKKTIVIVTAQPEGTGPQAIQTMAGFATEVAASTSPAEVKTGLSEALMEFNESKKGRKNPAKTLGELFEEAPARILKNNGILKKPKEPAEFVWCPNRA
jgi:hypothetical protein